MPTPEKRENSVLFSLRELRQIEESRVQEEEHAVRSAEEARAKAKDEAERRVREAEEAKIREERDHQRSIEESRVAAEREARMRVESTEATERQRHQAAIEQQRLQQEMELRRAEVAKKRPTWMLGVTAIAVIGIVLAVVVTINKMHETATHDVQAQKARAEADQAKKDSEEAADRVHKLEQQVADQQDKIDKAVSDVANAKNASDIAAAQSRLAQLQKEQADMKIAAAAARQAAEKANRAKGIHVSQKCLDNPLAPGCS
jgi:colicin import membrane protein